MFNFQGQKMYKLKQDKFKVFQAIFYKLMTVQDLEFLFPQPRTFKDSQDLYKTHSNIKLLKSHTSEERQASFLITLQYITDHI